MLKSLSISNYALIDGVKIDFESGLSVITGETGAGKSILLGALSLILGQRSDSGALFDKEKKCIVEGVFQIGGYNLATIFEEQDVDYEESTVIRREILPSGKSRAFVNDTPVNLSFLKDIGAQLIDVHSQHQNLLLSDNAFHMMVIDSVAKNGAVLEKYQEKYKVYKKLQSDIKQLLEENEKQKADVDYLQFQYDQLVAASLKPGELIELEQELEQLTHAEDIKSALVTVNALMGEEPVSILDNLRDAIAKLTKVSSFIADGEEWVKRLESAYIDLKDLDQEISVKGESIEYSPELIQSTQQRLDLLYGLLQKHRVENVDDLIVLRDEIALKLEKVSSFDSELKGLNAKLETEEKELDTIASQLSESRTAVFSKVQVRIEEQLKDLGMPHARLVIKHDNSIGFTSYGTDHIEFLFAGNKNGEPGAINKVASGGEMSRVMLSIKSLLSAAKDLPTIIFDEIDTGVSGEVADKMGGIMSEMGTKMQVISITHLPQIAVKGTVHYKVFKKDDEDKTVSQIERLSQGQREVEIAKMLSGAAVSEEALKNARALLNN